MKKQLILIFSTLLLLASCSKKEVVFTYSPTDPAAGESIKFTNSTEEGEEWAWTFGDGTTSTSKSPTKTYKKPGTYTVILKVDDKPFRTCTKTITVHDTIPAFSASDTTIYYYQKVTLTADSYNPYSKDRTFSWELPDEVKLLDGELDENKIDVCFTKVGGVRVVCRMTQGEESFVLDSTFQVLDTAARALVIARAEGIVRQRIYEYGFEEPVLCSIDRKALTNPTQLAASGDMLYIFNDDQTVNGTLACFDILNGTTDIVAKNAAAGSGQGFRNGCISDGIIYWTAADAIYRASATVRNIAFTAGTSGNQYLTTAAGIGYGLSAGLTSNGLMMHNGVLLYAYGSGLHRFGPDEIGHTPQEGSILTDYTISAFTIDPIAQKIYFCATGGLYVANFSGDCVVCLDSEADGKAVCVDSDDNKLFFTTAAGVMEMPLVHSANNNTLQTATAVNAFTDVTAMTVDRVQR